MKYRLLVRLFSLCLVAGVLLGAAGTVKAQDTNPLDPNDEQWYVYNMAHDVNGGQAFASSSHQSGNFPVASIVNGDRTGRGWGAGRGGWNDGTFGQFPDYLEIHFNSEKTIEEIDIFTLQDDLANPVEPTPEMTFSLYGIKDFNVGYFDSTTNQWVYVAFIRNNNKVWNQIKLSAPVNTSKLSIVVINALQSYSRVVEVEAWGRDGLRSISQPSSTGSSTNPCNEFKADPCQLTVDLLDAIQIPAKPTLTYNPSNGVSWPALLNWNFSFWNSHTSKNKTPLAHALTLWRPKSEWDPAGTAPIDRAQWWIDYLSCQVGDTCNYSATYLPYMKSDELLSGTYDADTTRAVVSVQHWCKREISQGRGNSNITALMFLAGKYLRRNWAMYAMSAGNAPAKYLIHRANRDGSLQDKQCQYRNGAFWYDGPFLALAGMRSPWGIQCQNDLSPLFTRVLGDAWPTTKVFETNAQKNLLNVIQQQQDAWKLQYPNTFPNKQDNAYSIDDGLRALIATHIRNGNKGDVMLSVMQGVKLLVEYHFMGWTDASGNQIRMTVMATNKDTSTIPTYAVIYRSGVNSTAEALIPFDNKSRPRQDLQSATPCFKSVDCFNNRDYSAQCFKSKSELDTEHISTEQCWTRQERNPGITEGEARLFNDSFNPPDSQRPSSTDPVDNFNPTKVRAINLNHDEWPFPHWKHGRIVEWIRNLGIYRKKYHIIYNPTTQTWSNIWTCDQCPP